MSELYCEKSHGCADFVTRLFVPQAPQISPCRRAKSDIWLAIPQELDIACGTRISVKNFAGNGDK